MGDAPDARIRQLEAENAALREEVRRLGTPLGQGLSKREALLVEAERVAHLGSWAWDLTAGEIEWSDEFYRILGLSPGSVAPSSEGFFGAIHQEDRQRAMDAARDDLASGHPRTLEFRIVRPDGDTRHVRMDAALLRDDSGRQTHMVGTVLDLTETLRSEKLLSESVEELRIAQRVARLGSWSFHFPSAALVWSEGMYALLGLRGDETPSEELFDRYVHPDDLPLIEGVRDTLKNGVTVAVPEFRIIRTTGETLTITAELQAYRDQDGQLLGFRGTLVDVSRRKALEEQLRHSQKMEAVGTLAGGVAHDFNNYLMVIAAHVEDLRMNAGLRGAQRASIEAISRASERCATLTSQLLMFSRRQTSRAVLLDLWLLLKNAEPMLRTALGESNTLVIQKDAFVGAVRADPASLEQALLNLVVNARDAMKAGGTLTLELKLVSAGARAAGEEDFAEKPYVRLMVRDTGEGIAPEHLGRVFEPFFTTKAMGRGTGLGLATTYGIIEQAGGHIRVESAVGAGTTFWVYLPLASGEPAVAPRPEGTRSRASTGGTVLLVEDVAEVRQVLARQLSRLGFRVLTAAHGKAALEILEGGDAAIDVVLSDVVMPVLGGLELERILSERHPRLPCLLMTGYTEHALLEGSRPVLYKPFTADELLTAVNDLLGRRDEQDPDRG